MDTGCDPRAWFRAACHVADISNHTAKASLKYRTPIELRDGYTPDISALIIFKFWEPVYYQMHEVQFPSPGGTEKLGRWLGRAMDYGDKICHYILTDDTEWIIVRSMVRSATNTTHPNLAFAQPPQPTNPNPWIPVTRRTRRSPIQPTALPGESSTTASSSKTTGESSQSSYSPIIPSPTSKSVKTPFPRAPRLRGRPVQLDPDQLINLYVYDTYTSKTGKTYPTRGQVKERIDETRYRVAYPTGKQKVYDYETIVNLVNKPDDDDAERWTFDRILSHRWSSEPGRRGKIDVLVKWKGYKSPTWVHMEVIKEDDPVTLAAYAMQKGLEDRNPWQWAKKYRKQPPGMHKLNMHTTLAKKKRRTTKFQFGVKIPVSIKEAHELDSLNKDTLWAEAIDKEVDSLYDKYQCFQVIPEDQEVPEGYQYIPLLWAFAVKYDGRRRARCVAGGHVTPDLDVDMYSGVVDLEIVRLAFIAAKLQDLQVYTADIGSAYIQAFTTEKVYTIAGPEFGSKQGQRLIVDKALYGLKSAGASWHAKLADHLYDMGFLPSKADYNLWIRPREDHYEYIAVIVDDLLIMSKNPKSITSTLSDVFNYKLKGVGLPEYYSGSRYGI